MEHLTLINYVFMMKKNNVKCVDDTEKIIIRIAVQIEHFHVCKLSDVISKN